MREIKFRAWDKEKKPMFSPLSIDNRDIWTEHGGVKGEYHCWYQRSQVSEDGELINVAPEHLMQFTGLLDKNGKEIYEGDIICVEGLTYTFNDITKASTLKEYCDKKVVEVIGNIHKNPELLEKQQG